MKKTVAAVAALLLVVVAFVGFSGVHSQDARKLKRELQALPGVSDVHFIHRPPYDDCLLMVYSQPVEYLKDSVVLADGTIEVNVRRGADGQLMADSAYGFFDQRVMIGFRGRRAGTVMVTEGYSIERYLNPKRAWYSNELSTLYGLNEVLVEHRYFAPSAPLTDSARMAIAAGTLCRDSLCDADFDLDWNHLSTLNAASDHHRVYEMLRPLLEGGWVATGASKGGLTCTMYATYYPEDMNLIVPYVSPFCVTHDDPRMSEFLLETVGTAEQRAHHNGLTMEALKRKAIFWDRFVEWCDSAAWKFQLPLDTIYQLAAMDMPVGLWMYYPDTLQLPALDCPDDTLWAWLKDNLGPDGLSCDRMAIPYDVQAAQELGCYGYDVRPYAEYLTLGSGKGLWQATYLPQDWTFTLDETMHRRVEHFLRTTTFPVLCVNGQNDPWTSVGFSPLFAEEGWSRDTVAYCAHDNVWLFTLPRGNHGSKIAKFPDEERALLDEMIKRFMGLQEE